MEKKELKPLVCILTPTYNRAKELARLYESLQKQTSKCFTWFIIDDGSSDNTKEIVNGWIKEDVNFKIIYHFKENGGKHTALNFGFKNVVEPLIFIVDSDDTITTDAVESIEKNYPLIKENAKVCGFIYLRGRDLQDCVGDKLVREGQDNLNRIRYKDKVNGDKAEVWKTDFLSQYQFPVFPGEKFIGENVIWDRLSEKYDIYAINKIIYLCEYLEGGLTKSGRSLRIRCPMGGRYNAKGFLSKIYPAKYRIKNAILYDCYTYFAHLKVHTSIKESGYPFITTVFIPVGWFLYLYWNHKYGK